MMLTAKIDCSVPCESMKTAAIEPTIARIPISSGSPAAISEPKTSSSSSIVTGIATDSALAMPSLTFVEMSLPIAGLPVVESVIPDAAAIFSTCGCRSSNAACALSSSTFRSATA